MKLYELTQEYQALQEMAEDQDVDFQAVMDTLEGIGGEFKAKADNIACVVKGLSAQADALKTESEALARRGKAASARADRLREYLFRQMRLAGISRIETNRNVIFIRKTPEALRFEDEGAFLRWAAEHPEYLRQKPPEIDKSAVKDAIKAGESLPGVALEQGETFSIR